MLKPHFNTTLGCFDLSAVGTPASIPASTSPFVTKESVGSVACSDWFGCGHGMGGLAWDYQVYKDSLPCCEFLKSSLLPVQLFIREQSPIGVHASDAAPRHQQHERNHS